MPRPRRGLTAPSLNVQSMEEELEELKARHAELRQRLRRMRAGSTEVRKLEEKLEKQLATAKWTAREIREINPDWDETGFYQSVEPRKPTPRGRRPRVAVEP